MKRIVRLSRVPLAAESELVRARSFDLDIPARTGWSAGCITHKKRVVGIELFPVAAMEFDHRLLL